MTRRERHLRIIESFGWDWSHRALERLLARKYLTILSDDGVEQLARLLLSELASHKKYAAENRRRLALASVDRHPVEQNNQTHVSQTNA